MQQIGSVNVVHASQPISCSGLTAANVCSGAMNALPVLILNALARVMELSIPSGNGHIAVPIAITSVHLAAALRDLGLMVVNSASGRGPDQLKACNAILERVGCAALAPKQWQALAPKQWHQPPSGTTCRWACHVLCSDIGHHSLFA